MNETKKYNTQVWVQLLIAGIASLAFGTTIFLFPDISLESFLWLRALYMFIKGVSLAIVVWQAKGKEPFWDFLLCFELMSIVISLLTVRYPEISIVILGFFVSVNLIISGIVQVVVAFHLPREVHRKLWLIASGTITVLAGLYIYVGPRVSSNAILFLFAIDLLTLGFFFISLSLAVRKLAYTN